MNWNVELRSLTTYKVIIDTRIVKRLKWGVELNISDKKHSLTLSLNWNCETDKFTSIGDWVHFDTSK